MADLAVETFGLTKTFGQMRALDRVDLSVPAGAIYGVLGPNGAGKTTIIRILATLLRPSRGSARVLGHDVVRDPDAVRERVSLTGQFASVDEDLTGLENLVVLGRLLGLSASRSRRRAHDLLGLFDLDAAAGRPVRRWSGGMRRRLDLAASIIVAPDLLFLDEPTTGLDPRSRNEVWAMVAGLVTEGTTVLLTTQYLDEADELADRIVLFDHGRVVAEGTTAELKASIGAGVLHLRLQNPDQGAIAHDALSRVLDAPIQVSPDPAMLTAPVTDPGRAAEALASLSRQGIDLADFALGQPSLDEVFLALTGGPSGADDPAEQETA